MSPENPIWSALATLKLPTWPDRVVQDTHTHTHTHTYTHTHTHTHTHTPVHRVVKAVVVHPWQRLPHTNLEPISVERHRCDSRASVLNVDPGSVQSVVQGVECIVQTMQVRCVSD
jgi:carbohydrate-binding DOMON domain-containing protein